MSLTLLGQSSAVSLTTLSQNSAVSRLCNLLTINPSAISLAKFIFSTPCLFSQLSPTSGQSPRDGHPDKSSNNPVFKKSQTLRIKIRLMNVFRVFNGISFREIFAKRKRNEFRNFAIIKSIFAKFRVSRKCHFSENKRNETKRKETKQTKRNAVKAL